MTLVNAWWSRRMEWTRQMWPTGHTLPTPASSVPLNGCAVVLSLSRLKKNGVG